MVRKTKEEALETRARILEVAEHVFSEQGVAHTSLQDIAAAAHVTRGAIYWHFKNKSDLLDAMVQQIKMPMDEAVQHCGSTDDPLGQLRTSAKLVLETISGSPSARRICEILFFKCEYVDETADLLKLHLEECRKGRSHYETAFRLAASRGQLRADIDPQACALGLHAMVHGMMADWMLSPDFDLVHVGMQTVDNFLLGLRHPTAPEAVSGP